MAGEVLLKRKKRRRRRREVSVQTERNCQSKRQVHRHLCTVKDIRTGCAA
jgi:hypothetical protein